MAKDTLNLSSVCVEKSEYMVLSRKNNLTSAFFQLYDNVVFSGSP